MNYESALCMTITFKKTKPILLVLSVLLSRASMAVTVFYLAIILPIEQMGMIGVVTPLLQISLVMLFGNPYNYLVKELPILRFEQWGKVVGSSVLIALLALPMVIMALYVVMRFIYQYDVSLVLVTVVAFISLGRF